MDLDEVLMLSDRVEVIQRGQIIGSADEHSRLQEIGLMMAGEKPGAPPRPEIS